jgi:hypothetical protein
VSAAGRPWVGSSNRLSRPIRARGAGGQVFQGNHRNCGRRERRLRHDQRRQEDRRSREHPAFAAACRCPQVGGSQTRAEEVRRPHKPRRQGTRGQLPAGDCSRVSGAKRGGCRYRLAPRIRKAGRHFPPLSFGSFRQNHHCQSDPAHPCSEKHRPAAMRADGRLMGPTAGLGYCA